MQEEEQDIQMTVTDRLVENRLRHHFDFQLLYHIADEEQKYMYLQACFERIMEEDTVDIMCLLKLPDFIKETIDLNYLWSEMTSKIFILTYEFEYISVTWTYDNNDDRYHATYDNYDDEYGEAWENSDYYDEFWGPNINDE